MKKCIYLMALAAATFFTTACSDEDVNDIQNIPDSQKEMISFSLSDGTGQTRAGFTGANTRIVARFQSEEKGSSTTKYTRTVLNAAKDNTGGANDYSVVSYYTSDNTRYWDDAFGRKALISVYAVAIPNSTSTSKLTDTKLDGDATWSTTATSNTIQWDVTKDAQTSTILLEEDLVYSNNIQADATLGKDGVYRWDYTQNKHLPDMTGATTHKDGRMLFFQSDMTDSDAATKTPTSAPGHFDKGHLKFKHALSRITIILEKGSGFSGTDPFAFASNNIKLLGMNVKGTLDIKTGIWTVPTAGGKGAIEKMAVTQGGSTNAVGTYMAQMLPDFVFNKTSTDNVAQFRIDDNDYFITQKMLFEALTYDKDGDNVYDQADGDGMMAGFSGSAISMEQGKNYQFKITVAKKQIESITATLAPWVEVTAADKTMDNSHVQFTFASPAGSNCSDFQFYRLKESIGDINTETMPTANNFSGNYLADGAATIVAMSGVSGKYQATGWYYDDNKTAYHFRTLNSTAADENGTDSDNKSENITTPTSDPKYSYFTMRAGAYTKEYHWGAPMKTDPTSIDSYSSTEGFKDYIHDGVTSTSSDLNITEMQMMSNIYVSLKTTTGAEKVNLTDATVRLTQLSLNATVDMGIGLITPNSQTTAEDWASVYQAMDAPSDYWKTTDTKTNYFSCAAIPQPLIRGTSSTPAATDYVGITIRTADGNEYYVVKELSELTANSVTGGHNVEEGVAIERWYPGHKYYYTFTITKKGIENITCVLTDWVTVTAADKDINLES